VKLLGEPVQKQEEKKIIILLALQAGLQHVNQH
jgi:hypothetical protein